MTTLHSDDSGASQSNSQRRALLATGLVAVTFGLALAARGARLVPDSASYLDNAPFRPPLYPLFLDAVQLAAGTRLPKVVVLLQGVAAVVTLARLLAVLRRHLVVGPLALVAVGTLLAFAQLRYAGDLSTESLTCSVFLLLVAEGVHLCFAPDDLRSLARALALTVTAVLLRPQFLFLWPVVIAGVAGLLRLAPSRRRGLRAVALIVVALLAGPILQRSYNLLRNGRPEGIHFTGVQLLTVNLYLADLDDVSLFHGAERQLAERLWHDMEQRRLFAVTRPAHLTSADYFDDVYVTVCLDVIEHDVARDDPRTIDQWAALDRATMSIATRLLRRHPTRYLGHVAGVLFAQFRYLALLAAALAALGLRYSAREPRWRLLLLASSLWLANVVLVCLVETPMARYTCYTDGVLVALLIAVLVDGTSRRATGLSASATG